MSDVVLLTPREITTGAPSINNQNVSVTDEEYFRLDPALRLFYEKVRENLGLACLTGYLRHAGHSVRSVNLHGRNPSDEAIVDLIRQERPRFVGISIMYDLHILDALRLARCVRVADPDVLVALGGAFCTYNAKLLTELATEVDCVAFGEAERTVAGIMDALDAGADWRDVPGLYYRDNGAIRTSGMPRLVDLAQPVWPARDLLQTYQAAGIPTPVASTFTSRGCHAKCTFCYAPRQPGITDGPWRMRPAIDVVDEIEFLQRQFGTRFIWFNDDNFGGAFSDGFSHAVEFAEEVIRRGLKFAFHAEFRVDSGLVDHEALDLLHRAGMKTGLLGMESGSAGVLKRFKKGTTVAYNFDAARIFRKKGIQLDPGWIMVEPQTSIEDLWENLQFIVASRVHLTNHVDDPFLLMNRAIALRGTEMFDAITDPIPPADVTDMDPVAYQILLEARRDYRIPDGRVEALWESWSEVAEQMSDRRENRLPFLANKLALTARQRDHQGGDPRRMLAQLRQWRNDLPQVFAAYLNLGLVLVDIDAADLTARLDSELRALVTEFDQVHLGMPFAEFEAAVERVTARD